MQACLACEERTDKERSQESNGSINSLVIFRVSTSSLSTFSILYKVSTLSNRPCRLFRGFDLRLPQLTLSITIARYDYRKGPLCDISC